ncbi:MAG: Na/Pi cotransporter family protein [Spirochaetales bacterium]|nr:Na/Pi cotransporter family protein [Spirochaetales bacterium]
MQITIIVFEIIGSLGLLLYGMKLMSDGIQKSAGEGLHRILNFMTGNRFMAVLTGLGITAIVQSSSATTVMTVSFVNAGLLTLTQSIGVIFGANIGTTITAWIVSLVGFKFKLALFAIPAFGVGYFITFFKRLHRDGLGEAIMGFGLLFLGLDLLSKSIPTVSADQLEFVAFFADKGTLGLVAGVMAGLLITIILHSSSAATAVILTMAHNGLLDWPFAAAMVLGSNIGTTIDAVLAAIGTKVNARRAAAVHVLFNLTGTVLAMIFFNPFLRLVEFVVPGGMDLESITVHLAMLHTVFNTVNTLIFLPFVNQVAHLVEWIIKPGAFEPPPAYKLEFQSAGIKENAESYVFRAEKEILEMSSLVQKMVTCMNSILEDRSAENLSQIVPRLAVQEDYADQMQEELSRFLVNTSQLPLSEKTVHNVRLMIRMVDDLESMTDEIYAISMLFQRSVDKKMKFREEDISLLKPYMELAERFIRFVHEHLNKPLSSEQLALAHGMEEQIDMFRKNLKKIARKRLEEGADVKAELLYIDIVRYVEKLGDHAFSISEALASTK